MRLRIATLALSVIVSSTGCSTKKQHIVSLDPSTDHDHSGSIVLHFTEPALISVSVDGELVADEKKNTKTLEIDGVPPGRHDVRVMVGGGREELDETYNVELAPGERYERVVNTPPVSTGQAILVGLVVGALVLAILASPDPY